MQTAEVPAVCAEPTEHDSVYVDVQVEPPIQMRERQPSVEHGAPLQLPGAPSATLR